MDTSLIAVYCLALVNACLYLKKKREAKAEAEKGDHIED